MHLFGVNNEADVLYRERISSRLTRSLFVALALMSLGLVSWRLARRGWDPLAFGLTLVLAFFLFCSFNYRVLSIVMTPEALRLRFGLIGWAIPLENIADAQLDDLPWFLRYGGAGVHFMFVRGLYRVSFNVLEGARIRIELLRPAGPVSEVSFSTRRPEEILQHLQSVGCPD